MNTYIVYYMKPASFCRFNFGQEFPTVGGLHLTHKRVRCFIANDLEDVFSKMQAEIWSPYGEQRGKIETLGLAHTSMSVGDVVYEKHSNKYFVVAPCGFKEMK
jgi:hypothetical protein